MAKTNFLLNATAAGITRKVGNLVGVNAPEEGLITGTERDGKVLMPSKKTPTKRRWFKKEEIDKEENGAGKEKQFDLFDLYGGEYNKEKLGLMEIGTKTSGADLFDLGVPVKNGVKDKDTDKSADKKEVKVETKDAKNSENSSKEEEVTSKIDDKKTDKTEGKNTERTNLTYNEERKRFEFKGSAQIKEIPKTAGFRWDNDKVVWHTADAKNAEKIKDWSDKATRELIEKRVEEHNKNIKDSWKQDSNKEFPSPMGLTYAGYQKAAIEFALKRKNILIADQMGLGKTIEAIGIINADESVKKVLIITPASLKYNWKKELLGDERKKGWLTRNMSVAIINPQEYSEGDIQIINYDILNRYKDKLKEANKGALVILDEAHYIKGHKAQRTKAAQELLKGANKRILMTGTPIMNRPIELYPLLQSLEDPLADNWVHYVRRYCDGYKNNWGWMVKGASHLDELQDKLRSSVMIRRLKSDVLKELPPKRRQIIEIPADDELKQFVNQEKNIVNQTVAETQDLVNEIQSMRDNKVKGEEYTRKVEQLREAKQYEFSELEKIRHQTALAKTKKILGDLSDLLETDEKFIIFAHHKDVIDMIYQHFKDKAVKITGSDSAEKKQEAVEKFQNDEKIKIFVGNIQAAGVGITLTASSTVIFIELDWSPSNMTQAEDRSNRIGQQKPVNVIHYVVDGSIDSMLAKKLVDKQEIIDKALDKSAEMEAAKKEIDILDTILS